MLGPTLPSSEVQICTTDEQEIHCFPSTQHQARKKKKHEGG